MTKITKGVIPCAGLGTRFLPITKSLPKELLPVIDTPVLQFIVDEAVNSGITDILIVINKSKEAIKHYFSADNQIIDTLLANGKVKEADMLKAIVSKANIVFEYQDKPKGSGDAVLYAEKFASGQPFALAWGDDLIVTTGASKPVMGQLADAYAQHNATILGVQTILTDEIVKYGVPAVSQQVCKSYQCTSIVEKPPLDKIPSRLAAMGRYILSPDIFDTIRNSAVHSSGELHLTTALNALAADGKLWAYDFEGQRFDMGDKLGSLKASIHFGLQRFGQDLKDYLAILQ